MKWSLVYTFFRSLSLAHLERSLYSLSKQTVKPDELLFFDNNTGFTESEIKDVISQHFAVEDWKLHFAKHGDASRNTASWCQNTAIRLASNDVFLFTKADCIYDFGFSEELVGAFGRISGQGQDPLFFTTSWQFQMPYLSKASHELVDHAADLEPLGWRQDPQRLLANSIGANPHTTTVTDAPCFCTTKRAMEVADWYDEELRGWTLWQPGLQSAMMKKGVRFCVVPRFLFFHMLHDIIDGTRDMGLALSIFQASRRQRI